jgi:hypothetical protein
MYYLHEGLLPILRELVGEATRLVFECRDPISTLREAAPGSPSWAREAAALRAADGAIVVSDALRDYYQQCHGVDLSDALVVPQAFAAATAAPPEPKLSAADGRIHLALVGTASADPGDSRWYVDIIRSLVNQGLVVHSHFHELSPEVTRLYALLGGELPDYHPHPTVSHRLSTHLSRIVSRYDLMGVFHQLDAPSSEAATLAVCLPTKAVSGWFHGAIPVVTTAHYRGVVERIARHGIGFVAETWAALPQVIHDRAAIAQATTACLAVRQEFAQETHAGRITAWYAALLARGGRWDRGRSESGTLGVNP